jgi:hypothetical protein
MDLRMVVPGLAELQADTLGDPSICIAVLDGPVDLDHPCFAGADVRRVPTLVQENAGRGAMSLHGTHVASLIFGRPDGPVPGIAPRCRGLLVPVFADAGGRLSQIDLARAIERAVSEGADVISISGGQRSDTGDADVLLSNALELCETSGVLVVAAVGNDGADTVHVPAGMPTALAVGATDADGHPLASNNHGAAYRDNALLTIGDGVVGAVPSGGTTALTGSSFATPVVAGVAALLLDLQRRAGDTPDPLAVRDALLAAAHGGLPADPDADPARLLGGHLDITATRRLISRGVPMETPEVVVASAPPAAPSPDTTPPAAGPEEPAVVAAQAPSTHEVAPACSCQSEPAAPAPAAPAVTTSSSLGQPVFVIGSIGHDFGTEANRDGFIAQMPETETSEYILPANPYDPVQLTRFLRENPWASDKLIWLCKHESMPIYALEAETSVGMTWVGLPELKDGLVVGGPPVSMVHKTLWDALAGQALRPDNDGYISRISIPGRLTDRTVRLFSGQVVPVVTVQATGMYTWTETVLVDSLVETVTEMQRQHVAKMAALRSSDTERGSAADEAADKAAQEAAEAVASAANKELVKRTLRAFLDKVYFQFRNLGASGPDRALNFAATNAFSTATALANGFLSGQTMVSQEGEPQPLYALDDITVRKSQFARHDSECYDVIVTFFDPTNDRQAKVAYLHTVDVSSVLPVNLAPTRQFLLSN